MPRYLLFASAGALGIALQTVLLRELMVGLSGDEGAIGLGLGAWLIGIAGGAVTARRLVRRSPARFAALSLSLLICSGPLLVLGGRFLRLLLAPPPGEILSTGLSLVTALTLLGPPGALVGATFTALAAAAADLDGSPDRGIGPLYVLESLGSLVGGIAVTWVVVPHLTPFRGAALLGAVGALLALPATARMAGRGTRDVAIGEGLLPGRGPLAILAAVLLALAVSPAGRRIEEASALARFAGLAPGMPLLAWTDTPYQNLAVSGDETRHLYSGGQYAGSFPDPVSGETTAHTVACLAPRTTRVLAIGAATLGPLRFLLRHPVEWIDFPQPDARALSFLRRHLPAGDSSALDDSRVRVVTDDPRRFLARRGDPYDLILVLEPDAVTLLLARLTTAEFFRLAASRLAPEGVLVVSLRTAPNVLTGETAALGGAVMGAIRSALPVVHATPGPDGFLVAGWDPASVTLDPAVLAGRWRERGLRSEIFGPEMFPVLFAPERVRAQESELARAAADVAASTDDRPVSFLHALARRRRISGGTIGDFFAPVARLPGSALAVLALLPTGVLLARSLVAAAVFGGRSLSARALGRRSLAVRSALHLTAVTGASGMLLSLLILFSYQTHAGVLYGQIGFLSALFMLGLAMGGAAGTWAASAGTARARAGLLAASGSTALFGACFASALAARGQAGPGAAFAFLAVHGAALLLAGLVTGGVFPTAATLLLSEGCSAGDAAGSVEAADHAGAAIAAVAGALLLVPTLGLANTAWLVVAVQTMGTAAAGLDGRSPMSRNEVRS